MNLLFAIIGLAIGFLQLWMLSIITGAILGDGNKKKIIFPLIAKVVIYTVSLLCIVFLFRDYILPFAIGLGVGIIGSAVVNFVGKSHAKKE